MAVVHAEVKITPEMIEAGITAIKPHYNGTDVKEVLKKIYEAMHGAAPPAEASQLPADSMGRPIDGPQPSPQPPVFELPEPGPPLPGTLPSEGEAQDPEVSQPVAPAPAPAPKPAAKPAATKKG